MNKREEILIILNEKKPDIFALTETWLSESIDNSEISVKDYQLFRLDRNSQTKGGGLLLYINSCIPAVQITDSTYQNCRPETLWVTIKQKNAKPLLIGLIYRPPNQGASLDDKIIDQLRCMVAKSDVMIVGDFNAPSIDWELLSTASSNLFDNNLLNFTLDMFLVQHVDFNTRFRDGQQPSCLDLIFTKDEESLQNLQSSAPLGLSDHVLLSWNYTLFSAPKPQRRLARNIWKADTTNMHIYLQSLDWSSLMTENIEQTWQKFKDIMKHLVENYCPLTPAKSRSAPPWLTPELKKLLKKKRRLWKLSKSSDLPKHHQEYREVRNKCKTLFRTCRMNYDTSILENAIHEPKKFYGYINSKLKCRDHIPCLKNDSNVDVTDDIAKAELMSKFFHSVFTSETPQSHLQRLDSQTCLQLDMLSILEEDVKQELKRLKPAKSAGPDEIPARLLHLLADDLASPISSIFKQSLQSATLPQDWKSAIISPIYKGGPKHSANSFRPISLTSICCKIMERLLKRQITNFLESNNLFTDAQHGFRRNRSCLTNLILSEESWKRSLDEKNEVDVIYIDFRKAFDSVPHERLLNKLSCYGIAGKLHEWLKHFITGRTQRVQVNGCISQSEDVTSGVPQGSVLGPLLFLLYVNDIPANLNCDILMFADDLKIWKAIKSNEDSAELQRNVDYLQEWSDQWLLKFNTSKCSVLSIRSRETVPDRVYHLDGSPMRSASFEKDLGVTIESNLKPSIQCAKSAKKAMSVMRRIKRTFPSIKPDIFTKIYPTFVRSHLEYGVQAWRPWLSKDRLLLENVQRRSTKLVDGMWNIEHTERERMLNLFSLAYRQDRGDLILAFKIIRGVDCCLKLENFFEITSMPNLRGHPWKLTKTRSRLLLRQHSFSQRVVNLWNKLPEFVAAASSVAVFKSRLDVYAGIVT
jgi:hypothetical protein